MEIIRIGVGSTELPSAEIVGAKAANLARIAALRNRQSVGRSAPAAFGISPFRRCAIDAGDARHCP
jgi:hypothetical protein